MPRARPGEEFTVESLLISENKRPGVIFSVDNVYVDYLYLHLFFVKSHFFPDKGSDICRDQGRQFVDWSASQLQGSTLLSQDSHLLEFKF